MRERSYGFSWDFLSFLFGCEVLLLHLCHVRNREILGREMVPMRWGLIPDWWKKPRKEVPATFNARAETVAEKPMFRGAFRYRRCITPASGFYEWTGPRTARQPHLFTAADGSPALAFAGLWDHWIDPGNFDEVISATIIVSGASAWMRPYHERMPVLLEPQDFDAWLDGSLGPAALKPAAEEKLRELLVSPGSIGRMWAMMIPRSSSPSHLSDGKQFFPIGRIARYSGSFSVYSAQAATTPPG
jgi:putative SOS response-associated peptidase YedK